MIEHLSNTPYAPFVQVISFGHQQSKLMTIPGFELKRMVSMLEPALIKFTAIRKMSEACKMTDMSAEDDEHLCASSVLVQLLTRQVWSSLKEITGTSQRVLRLMQDVLDTPRPNDPSAQTLQINLSKLTLLQLPRKTHDRPVFNHFRYYHTTEYTLPRQSASCLLSAYTTSLQVLNLTGISFGNDPSSVVSFGNTIRDLTLSDCEGSGVFFFGLIEPLSTSLRNLEITSTVLTSGSWLPTFRCLDGHSSNLLRIHVESLRPNRDRRIAGLFEDCEFGRDELKVLASLHEQIASRNGRIAAWFILNDRQKIAKVLLEKYGIVLDKGD